MGILNDIRQKLLSGYTVSQLIKEGYAKSSVNHVARQLKNNQKSGTTITQVDDELHELRHQKEVVKLRKEITELEAAGDKLPERVIALEKTIHELRSLMVNAVDTALFESLVYAGMDENVARDFANGWVKRNIKG